MNKTTNTTPNRIDELGARWEARRQGYIAQYGPQVLDDREFIKATRDMYRTILADNPYNKLSFDEKISYRIMRGQRRHLNRHLYPNPIIRAVRNILVAGFRLARGIVRLAGRILNRMLAVLTGTNGIQLGQQRRRQPNRTLIGPRLQNGVASSSNTMTPHRTVDGNTLTVHHGPGTVVQQVPYPKQTNAAGVTNQTVQPQKVDRVEPRRFQKPRVVSMNTPTNGQRI